MSDHLKLHGDGVLDIAFLVDDVDECFKEAVKRGAKPALEPYDRQDEHGTVRRAKIRTYGDTLHSFLSTKDYNGTFLPGYQKSLKHTAGCGLNLVDHIVGNVEDGKMDEWERLYGEVLGFHRFMSFDDKDISPSSRHCAARSWLILMRRSSSRSTNQRAAAERVRSRSIWITTTVPAKHVALTTNDILHTVSVLRENGVDFLGVPSAYYDGLTDRIGPIEEDIAELKRLKILVDRDEHGYLLQIFTKPVEDRPTLFYEIIQREGSNGFGKGNFKALFEAIEREQAKRGNL